MPANCDGQRYAFDLTRWRVWRDMMCWSPFWRMWGVRQTVCWLLLDTLASLKHTWLRRLRTGVLVVAAGLLFGYVLDWTAATGAGLYYTCCGPHLSEQAYIDQSVAYLKRLRARCKDPDLQGVLDYTIRRYSRVGPWDVMFCPTYSAPGRKTIALNQPYCPGITLDPCMLTQPPKETALILVHEALHDYWPYWGHSHVTPRMERLKQLATEIWR